MSNNYKKRQGFNNVIIDGNENVVISGSGTLVNKGSGNKIIVNSVKSSKRTCIIIDGDDVEMELEDEFEL